jgi:hypothetical protein
MKRLLNMETTKALTKREAPRSQKQQEAEDRQGQGTELSMTCGSCGYS